MLLAIETSSLVSSVALLHEDSLRAELTIQAKLTHSEQLMPHIADMLSVYSLMHKRGMYMLLHISGMNGISKNAVRFRSCP